MKKSRTFGTILCVLVYLFVSGCGTDLLFTTGTDSTNGETGGTTGGGSGGSGTGDTGGSGGSGGGSASPSWKDVGSPGFSTGEVEYVSFTGDPNGNLYVGYQDKGGNYKGVVKRGTFSGNWEELYSTNPYIGVASVTVNSSGMLYAAFGEQRNLNYEIHVRARNGSSWTEIGDASSYSSFSPLIGIFEETPYVLLNSNEAITYSENIWISIGPIAGEGQNKSLYVQQDTGTPCVTYMDQNNNTGYVDKYNGENWEPIGNPTAPHFDTNLKDGYGNISLGWWNGEYSTAPIVAYRKDDGNIYVKKLYKDVNFYWDYLGSNPIGYCQSPPTNDYKGVVSLVVVTTSVSPPKGKVYVAFRDGNNEGKVTVKVCNIDNPVWETVGGGPASAGAAEYINLIVLNNVPYIAYKDSANGGKITVRKYE